MQKGDLTQKWVLFGGPNMALTNMYFKTKLVSCLGERRETVEREEEGEKKRKKMEEPRSSQQGMETEFKYECLTFV